MTNKRLPASISALFCVALVIAPVTPVAAQASAPKPPTASASPASESEEIVVTAQRSGIPVWHVVGPQGTAVLVGSIDDVTPGTKWDPASLDAALARADRVMFPESRSASLGLFSAFGAVRKILKQRTLPKKQTLQSIATPAQWARLVALRDRGVLKPGFERRHPWHLAGTLTSTVGDGRKSAPGADSYARRFLKKNKAKLVPTTQIAFKPFATEFFGSAPAAHMPCLMEAVTLAEAGAAGTEARARTADARSAAWSERRVPDALAARSPARTCWPKGTPMDGARETTLSPTVRGLLAKPEVTLAVVSLDALAKPGGVLDDLVAAGFDVRGPRWRR